MMVRYTQKIVCFLAVSIFIFAGATGVQAKQPEKPDSQGPSQQGQPIIYAPQFNYNFGEITEGSDASHDFTIKNTGAGELIIERVGTS